jgi:putative membrane protein
MVAQGRDRRLIPFLLAATAVVFVWSAIGPRDRFTWVLEVFPAVVALPILYFTRERFPLTLLTYTLIALHAVILMVGGHYTYAEVPLFNWMRDTLGLARNHYDRVGHFAQGFVPAIIAREVLLRRTPLRPGGWLFAIVSAVCLAISALYELLEWSVAAATGEAAEAFLGTQGDPWDTQKDMALCLAGALLAQIVLARTHDRQLRKLPPRKDCSGSLAAGAVLRQR